MPRLYHLILLLFLFLTSIDGALEEILIDCRTYQKSFENFLLPDKHPLQNQLKKISFHQDMFDSPENFCLAGFNVLPRVHRGLMIAEHPSIKGYLFKKFQNNIPLSEQLNNFLARIQGANALNHFITHRHLQHIVAPLKWLYLLPKSFWNSPTKEKAYLLIVEKMDICSGGCDQQGEVAQRYFHIEKEVLKELCIVLHRFRGLDSMLHNMPFTYQNQIAFIDTEKWDSKRKEILWNVKFYLTPENHAYALTLWHQLTEKK